MFEILNKYSHTGHFEFHADDNLRIVCNGFQDTNLYRKYDVVEMTIMMMGPGTFFNRLVPENQPYYEHTLEGSDDMPAHAKSTLSGVSITIPITNGKLNMGTWLFTIIHYFCGSEYYLHIKLL